MLATKVSERFTRERVVSSAGREPAAIADGQARLRSSRYSWDNDTPLEETLAALTTLVEQGKVRAIGCSNWSAWQLCKALLLIQQQGLAPLASTQPPYNLVQREIEADLLPLCADQQIGTITYSPLAAGFLTGKYRRGQEVPNGTRFDVMPGHQPIYFTDHGYATLEQLDRAAEQSGRSMIQLALSWVLRQAGITSVLIGARNTAQVDQAFDAAEVDIDWQLPAETNEQ